MEYIYLLYAEALVCARALHQIWSNKEGGKDISPEDVGRTAIIEGSYADKGKTGANTVVISWPDELMNELKIDELNFCIKCRRAETFKPKLKCVNASMLKSNLTQIKHL